MAARSSAWALKWAKKKSKKEKEQYKITQEMRVSEKASLNGWFRPQTLVQKLDSTFSGFDSTDSLIMISSSAGQTALSTATFVELGSGEEWKPLRGPIPSLVRDAFYDNNIYLCRKSLIKVNKVKFIQQFLKLLVDQNDLDDFEPTSVTYHDKQNKKNKLSESILWQWEQETPAITAYCTWSVERYLQLLP